MKKSKHRDEGKRVGTVCSITVISKCIQSSERNLCLHFSLLQKSCNNYESSKTVIC